MNEHRLIERMVSLIKKHLNSIKETEKADPDFIDAAVDFFRTYADKTHHGKEEDILFRELGRKPISEEHRKIMGELLEEHVIARQMVENLHAENKKYTNGDEIALQNILDLLNRFVSFYPAHIEKEDGHFFIAAMTYFDEKEMDLMIQEFITFDKNMIHEKYKSIVDELENK